MSGPPVWGRNGEVLWSCPKSFVTAESEALLEKFLAIQRLGQLDLRRCPAREADAFAILDRELSRELKDAQQNRGRDSEGI